MQLAIWPTPPALMLVAYRFSKLFADRFCAIGASNQTHFMTPPRPTTTTITRDKRFLSLADWLMGLEIAFLLRVQTRIWVAFWQLILRWTTVYMLTGALSCFVSCGRKGRRKLLPCSAVFFSLWQVFAVCSDTPHDPMSVSCRRSSLMSLEDVRTANVFWQINSNGCGRNLAPEN